MIRKKYYEMTIDDKSKGGNAHAPEDEYYDICEKVMHMTEVTFLMTLENNKYEDFILNDLCLPLMSSKLKAIIDRYASEATPIRWLPVNVVSKNKIQSIEYYFLIFTEKPDVLDYEKTRMIDDDYIYGYFIYEKINKYSFFPHPREFDFRLVVCEQLKKEITDARLTGISFEKAEVTY